VKGGRLLTGRFDDALLFAIKLHAGQRRKGSDIPYVSHLLAVAALVLEAGGDEDQAIAALLHDAVEDQGGLKTLQAIQQRYGERVAHIVEGCSDATEQPKPPWRPRKEAHLERLRQADADVRLVALADKLHNARSILEDLSKHGSMSLDRFRGGPEGTLWYYQASVDIFQRTDPGPRTDELARIVAQIATWQKSSSQA
jgi:(p)ppGpp synthase/HD superfamily hydrolase